MKMKLIIKHNLEEEANKLGIDNYRIRYFSPTNEWILKDKLKEHMISCFSGDCLFPYKFSGVIADIFDGLNDDKGQKEYNGFVIIVNHIVLQMIFYQLYEIKIEEAKELLGIDCEIFIKRITFNTGSDKKEMFFLIFNSKQI